MKKIIIIILFSLLLFNCDNVFLGENIYDDDKKSSLVGYWEKSNFLSWHQHEALSSSIPTYSFRSDHTGCYRYYDAYINPVTYVMESEVKYADLIWSADNNILHLDYLDSDGYDGDYSYSISDNTLYFTDEFGVEFNKL